MMTEGKDCGLLECAAYFALGVVVLRFVYAMWKLFNTYFLGSYPYFERYGEWSVVTGATDGIGLAFAHKLAKCGQNIVLISRNKDKLQSVAEHIEKKYDVTTLTIEADFAKQDIYEEISRNLKGLNIGVLINNVGISFSYPEFFLEVENLSGVIDNMMSINMMSTVKMIEIVLPVMVVKKKGIILNVSSAAAVRPTPMLSLYSASKLYVDCFSKTLNSEYKSKGIIVQCLMPYYVTTKLSKIRRPSLMVPTPETYVSTSLQTIGKSYRTYGYLPHALQAMVVNLLPDCVYEWISDRMHLQIRKRALKKKAEKKE